MIKLILRLLQNRIYQVDKLEVEKMQDWLVLSYKNNGFKHYYTMRKKYLMSLLSLGLEGKEQWEAVGRLKELKGLSANINAEVKKKKHKNKLDKKKG